MNVNTISNMHSGVKNLKSSGRNKKNGNKTVLKIITNRKKTKLAINRTSIQRNLVEQHKLKSKKNKKGRKNQEQSVISKDVSLLMPKLDVKPDSMIDKLPKKLELDGSRSEMTEQSGTGDPKSNEELSQKEVHLQPKKKRKIDVENTENNEIHNPELVSGEESTNIVGKHMTSKESGRKSKSRNKEPNNAESNEEIIKPKNFVLFLGNLPYVITEAQVEEHFKVVKGSIKRVTLLTNPKTGEGRGCGFLELTTAKAYHEALKLNLSQLQDRKINVEFTVPGKKGSKRRNKYMKMKTKKLLGQWKKGKRKGHKMKKNAV